MNILAHLHLASLAGSSLIGNAAADFVKGDPYQQYPVGIADGIMMHRRLDKWIDELAAVKHAKSLFRPSTQRLALITLDIVWDHFLAKHWVDYVVHPDLAQFNLQMKGAIAPELSLFPAPFSHFMAELWQGDWLIKYAQIEFIARVLQGMARQRPKLASLVATWDDVTANYHQLAQIFAVFYPQLMARAVKQQI